MKKILPLLIIGLFVLTAFQAVAIPHNLNNVINDWNQLPKQLILNRDEVDQNQSEMDWFAPVGPIYIAPDINFYSAQSFTPTKIILTRVALMAGKNSTTTYDFTFAIRDNLTGPDLTTLVLDPTHFPTEDFGWVEFDFTDLIVTPGSTYYIVASTTDAPDNWYVIGAQSGDPYPNGTVWISEDEGITWEGDPDFDLTFKTYGRDNQAPTIPEISGVTNGKAGVAYNYTFVSTDPDGDDVYYWIKWGDGCPAVEWIGPYQSGELVNISHTFVNKGDYTIEAKAKDIYNAESDWGTLDVSMPLTKKSTDSIFGWTIIRGLVANLKKIGKDLYFRTIRLHYTEFTGMEFSMGVLKGKRCRVSDLGYDRQVTFGPLGSFTWIFGFCHGGIQEL